MVIKFKKSSSSSSSLSPSSSSLSSSRFYAFGFPISLYDTNMIIHVSVILKWFFGSATDLISCLVSNRYEETIFEYITIGLGNGLVVVWPLTKPKTQFTNAFARSCHNFFVLQVLFFWSNIFQAVTESVMFTFQCVSIRHRKRGITKIVYPTNFENATMKVDLLFQCRWVIFFFD